KVVLAKSVHPHYRDCVRTYVQNLGIEVVEVGWASDGRIDTAALSAACDGEVFAIAVQSPNFLGVLEDYDAVASIADAAGAANMYLSLMGKKGLREVGTHCLQKAAYLRGKLGEIASVALPYSGPVYNEFVVRTPIAAKELLADLEHEKILGGIPLGDFFENA